MNAYNFGKKLAQLTKQAAFSKFSYGPIAGGSLESSPFHGPQMPGAPRGPSWARGTGHSDKVTFNAPPAPAPRRATPAAPSWQTTMQQNLNTSMPALSDGSMLPENPTMSPPQMATYTPSSPRQFGANVAQNLPSPRRTTDIDPPPTPAPLQRVSPIVTPQSVPQIAQDTYDDDYNGLSPDALNNSAQTAQMLRDRETQFAQQQSPQEDLILPSPQQAGLQPSKPLIPNVIAKARPFSTKNLPGAPPPGQNPITNQLPQIGDSGPGIQRPAGMR